MNNKFTFKAHKLDSKLFQMNNTTYKTTTIKHFQSKPFECGI